jgi:hypothetical protein
MYIIGNLLNDFLRGARLVVEDSPASFLPQIPSSVCYQPCSLLMVYLPLCFGDLPPPLFDVPPGD